MRSSWRLNVTGSAVGLQICVGTLFSYADAAQILHPHKHQLPHGLPLPVQAQFVDGLDPSVPLALHSSRGGRLI